MNSRHTLFSENKFPHWDHFKFIYFTSIGFSLKTQYNNRFINGILGLEEWFFWRYSSTLENMEQLRFQTGREMLDDVQAAGGPTVLLQTFQILFVSFKPLSRYIYCVADDGTDWHLVHGNVKTKQDDLLSLSANFDFLFKGSTQVSSYQHREAYSAGENKLCTFTRERHVTCGYSFTLTVWLSLLLQQPHWASIHSSIR